MKKVTKQGFVPIVALGITVLITLVGALFYTMHEPGNPPFSFIKKEEKKIDNEINNILTQTPVKTETSKTVTNLTVKKELPSQKQYTPQQSCTSNINPQFTSAFTDLSVINAINPIGGIGGGSPGRSYIGVLEGKQAPIYAPANGILRTIIYVDRGEGYGEYGIFLKISCEVEILFDHIDKISDRLMKYAPKDSTQSSATQGNNEINISIQAGELLGYTDGTSLAHTFDFLVTNYGKKNKYINPKRWEWEQALYGTCPYDYFVPTLKSLYYEKLGKPSMSGFIKSDTCGNPSHDIAGTASGGWFKGDSTDKRGDYMAIAKQYNEVQIATRKDGLAFPSQQDVVQGKNSYFNLTDSAPKKYPSEIKLGESVCYESNNKWAFIKLLSNTELSFASGSGMCPSDFPSSQAETWSR